MRYACIQGKHLPLQGFALALIPLLLLSGCSSWLSHVDNSQPADPSPLITSSAQADNITPEQGDVVMLDVGASDPQGQALTYTWDDGGAGGTFEGTGSSVTWTIDTAGVYTITVEVSDTDGNTVSSSVILTVNAPGTIVITTDAQAGYVGRDTCLGCHSGDVDAAKFKTHRHNHKLNPPTSEFIGDWWTGSQTLDGIDVDFGMDGSSYVMQIAGIDHQIVRTLGWGFEKWKQRYIVKEGNSWYVTPAQWNVVTEEWVPYHVSEWDAATGMPGSLENSYDRRCIGCHATGVNVQFSAETGEWVQGVSEENIQCEACHGPGEVHAGAPSPANIILPSSLANYARSIEVCGSCHGRGSSTAELGTKTLGYPFKDGNLNFRPGNTLADFYEQTTSEDEFWQDGPGGTNGHSRSHHQQYNDFKRSKHYLTEIVACWTCHDPHEPDAPFDNSRCTSCHANKAGVAEFEAHTKHSSAQVSTCIECHMPYTAKSAIAYDVRSHTFDIIPPSVSQAMAAVAPDKIIPNSCMTTGCHGGPAALSDPVALQKKVDDYATLFGGS